ncbi:MAG: RNase adapter RapZ [Bryobacterales bacterium]|nr:RNase adapter RapZ [Bryobacterales bacterium]
MPPRGNQDSAPELVIITGLSGSGKGTVLKALEDIGYYSVDNMPLDLLRKFAELTKDSPNIRRAALVVDIREGGQLKEFPALYGQIRQKIRTRMVFLDTDDRTLVRRYSETRRPHPLGRSKNLMASVRAERRQLRSIRELADHVINTSELNVHELRRRIIDTFEPPKNEGKLRVYVMSFGFRHGVPQESDLVFDVRFLPNPNYVPSLKKLTGRSRAVARFVAGFPQTQQFLSRVSDLLTFLLPYYTQEGKTYLTISIGCTGGRHRSVMMAEEIYGRLKKAGYAVKLNHRDIEK